MRHRAQVVVKEGSVVALLNDVSFKALLDGTGYEVRDATQAECNSFVVRTSGSAVGLTWEGAGGIVGYAQDDGTGNKIVRAQGKYRLAVHWAMDKYNWTDFHRTFQ